MPRLPHKLSATTPQAVLINQIIDYLASITPKDSETVRVKHGPFGVVYEANPGSGGSGTFKFNITGEYDPARLYKLLDCAIISTGPNAGTYVYISNVASSGQAPYVGGGWWAQFPMGPSGMWL
jgi:hypothetical protein